MVGISSHFVEGEVVDIISHVMGGGIVGIPSPTGEGRWWVSPPASGREVGSTFSQQVERDVVSDFSHIMGVRVSFPTSGREGWRWIFSQARRENKKIFPQSY